MCCSLGLLIPDQPAGKGSWQQLSGVCRLKLACASAADCPQSLQSDMYCLPHGNQIVFNSTHNVIRTRWWVQRLERLQSRLHMLGAPAERRHQVFVDDEPSARSFKPAEFFETDESLLDRSYNRPRLSQLEAAHLAPDADDAPQLADRAGKYVH